MFLADRVSLQQKYLLSNQAKSTTDFKFSGSILKKIVSRKMSETTCRIFLRLVSSNSPVRRRSQSGDDRLGGAKRDNDAHIVECDQARPFWGACPRTPSPSKAGVTTL